MRRVAPAVAAHHPPPDLDPPTGDTLRKAAAAKRFIEALAEEQQRRVAAARAAAAGVGAAPTTTAAATAAASPQPSSRRSARPSPSDYASLALIGRGAFGEVRLCVERATGARVAVKALAKADMVARGQVGHVRSERDALAASPLRACPFIVRLRATFQDAARLFLVMEFCPGGDLLTLLQRADTLPPPAARFYGAQLVAAVAAIHGAGYVHRDVKPDNVLLGSDGHIKLSDFGLCTAVEWAGAAAGGEGEGAAAGPLSGGLAPPPSSSTDAPPPPAAAARPPPRRVAAYSTVGTPDYIAPEVLLRSPGGYGPAADWWSVGAVLYEALAGRPPFASPSPAETVRRAVAWREHLVLPPAEVIGPDAVDLLARLLCDAGDRLGAGPGGADEVRGHPFFAGVDWDWGALRSLAPPAVPSLSGPDDVSHFDDFSGVDDGGAALGMAAAESGGRRHDPGGAGSGAGSGAGGGGGGGGPAHPADAPWPSAGQQQHQHGRRWARADVDFAGYTFRGTCG